RMTAPETQDGLAAARVPSSARPNVRAGLCVAEAEATRSGRGAGRNLGASRDTANARAVAVAGGGNCGAGGRSILVYLPGLASQPARIAARAVRGSGPRGVPRDFDCTETPPARSGRAIEALSAGEGPGLLSLSAGRAGAPKAALGKGRSVDEMGH